MKRLIIERKPRKFCKSEEYIVKNKKGDILGQIAYWKVYKKKGWFFFVDWNPMDGERDFWISADCLRQIADFIDKLKKKSGVRNE